MLATGTKYIVALQLLVVSMTLAAGLAMPPRRGEMLLLPLTGKSAGTVAALALAGGARIVGRGRLPGSLLVSAERGAMLARALPAGIVVLRAGLPLCGEERA